MTYPGGKSGGGAAHRIISLMPPHEIYIEPFCGSAAVYRMKRPAAMNIILDLDPAALKLARGDRQSSPMAMDPDLHLHILGDGLDFLEHHNFLPNTVIYCDPPYVRSARKSAKDLYNFEFTDHHHSRLLAWAAETKAMVIISGYSSELYDLKLPRPKWHSESFAMMTRRGPATETLWFNFERPAILHDPRFIGDNFRERERIRRLQTRWRSRIAKMPDVERHALMTALTESE